MYATRRPLPYFIYGNIVFPEPGDPWALYRLAPQSYAGLSLARKVQVMGQLKSMVQRVQADFQLLRIARPWSVREYLESTWQTFDRRHGSPEEIKEREQRFDRLLRSHAAVLEDRQVVRPEIYMTIRLREANGSIGDLVGTLQRLRDVCTRSLASTGLRDARGLRYAELAEIERAERKTHERVLDYVDCERARASDAAWLVRHAYVRSLGEPRVERNFRPQAIAVENGAGEEIGFEPQEWDLHRLHSDHRVRIGMRHLEIDGELGTSYQAGLVCGALPEEREFPGPEAELMFAPVELEFPVDAILHAEYLPNRDAQRLARKRALDADQMWREEAESDHGPSPETDDRPADARDLQRRLGGSDHPPLIRTALSFIVSSGDGTDDLEERVERLRSEVGARIDLHRPIAAQHELFLAALPAEQFPLSTYREFLLPEELAAMVPTASSHAGSELGPYIGYTLTPSRQPIRLDLAEPAQEDLPTPILITGRQGGGKTTLLQLLEYQGFLQGSAPIVIVDPRGTPEEPDHRLHLIPEVVSETEQILLSDDEEFRGLIDPLRIAPPGIRGDAAFDFALELLPDQIPAPWQTEIRAAIDNVCGSEKVPKVFGSVVEDLDHGNDVAREAARALLVHGNAGLAKLAFGLSDRAPRDIGESRVVLLQTKDLQLPLAGAAPEEMSALERLGTSLLRLIAMYALRLTERSDRHSIFSLDEAWVLLKTSLGRKLLAEMARSGRFKNVTALFSTQLLEDLLALRELFGAIFSGGVKTDDAAEAALELHGLGKDPQQVQRQLSYRSGEFLFTDFRGQTVPMKVHPCDPATRQIGTTPAARANTGSPNLHREAAAT